MGKIGSGELIVILLVALLIFGPAKLPALGKMAGKAVGTLKHYADSTNWDELAEEEEPVSKQASDASAKEENQPEKASENASQASTDSSEEEESQVEQAS